MEALNIEELHTTICTTYQNILDLSPVLKEVAAASKHYYKSLQNVANSSLAFQQALAKLSQTASSSKGPAKPLGKSIDDIVKTHSDIESRRADILQYMLNDFIAPLDSLVETDVIYVKSVQKNYIQDNKTKSELIDKAKSELLKVRKKSQRKKPTEKYEEKEKQCEEQVNTLRNEIETFRKESCMKSLSEEWKRYCFVVDRASIVLKSCMEFYEYNAAMLREKIPTWFAQVKRKPEGQANGTIPSEMPEMVDEISSTTESKIKLQAIFEHNAVEVSQLSFQTGDIIDPVSEVVSGWQYGQNLSTFKSGWFPAAYTQQIIAVPTGLSASQTMPVSGVHSRPKLDSPKTRSLKRFASEGPATMAPLPLPVADYGDLQTTEVTKNGNTEQDSEPSTPTSDKPPSVPSTTTTPKTHPQLGPPPPPPPPPPTSPDDEDKEESSAFANVTLKKTSTNDRSAPRVDVV